MRSRRLYPGIALALLVLFTCCTKPNYIYVDEFDTPLISPVTVTNVEFTSASLTSKVVSDGGLPIYERGFFYSSSKFTPSSAGTATRVISGKGIGSFSVELSGLVTGTDYWSCAYAKSDGGETVYTDVVQFRTGEKPSVTITGVEKSEFSQLGWHEQKNKSGYYSETMVVSLDIRCVSQIEKIGVRCKVIDTGWEDESYICRSDSWSMFPENDGIYSIGFDLEFDEGGHLELTPFLELKGGSTQEFAPYNINVETGDVKGDYIIEPYYVQWYSDPDWNEYDHFFGVRQTLYSGAENVSKIGFNIKNLDDKDDSFDYTYEDIAITSALDITMSLRSNATGDTASLYGTGKFWLKNSEQQYIEVYGSANYVISSFEKYPGYEWFLYENFKLSKCHFAADGWIISDSGAVASSDKACEFRLTSDELDLTKRDNAMLEFYSKIDLNIAGVTERHAVFVSDDNGISWTELKIENLETDTRDGEERLYMADLAEYLGKKIKIAFVYYGGGAWTISLLAVGTDHSENTTKSISNDKTISRVRYLSRKGRNNGIVRAEERSF